MALPVTANEKLGFYLWAKKYKASMSFERVKHKTVTALKKTKYLFGKWHGSRARVFQQPARNRDDSDPQEDNKGS